MRLVVRPSMTNVFCGQMAERIKLIFGTLLTLDPLPGARRESFCPHPKQFGREKAKIYLRLRSAISVSAELLVQFLFSYFLFSGSME